MTTPSVMAPNDRQTSAAHTPGPWFYAHRKKSNGKYSTQVFDGVDETIADVAWYPVQLDDLTIGTRRDANARLIAAAPDLFTALTDMVTGAIEMGHGDHPFVTRARSALSRAKGERT